MGKYYNQNLAILQLSQSFIHDLVSNLFGTYFE
jgi:hypothetical protein